MFQPSIYTITKLALLVVILVMGTLVYKKFYGKPAISAGKSDFRCTAVIEVINPPFKFSGVAVFVFEHDRGSAFINGSIWHERKMQSEINREIYFKLSHDKQTFYLDKIKLILNRESPSDEKANTSILPVYLLKDGQKMVFQILPVGERNFVFYNTPIPSFYCRGS